MKTLEDWKNGADYSDEAYEKYHNVFASYDAFGKFLKIFFVIIVCLLATGLAIWQWENILKVSNSIYSFMTSHPKVKEIVVISIGSILVASIPLITLRRKR